MNIFIRLAIVFLSLLMAANYFKTSFTRLSENLPTSPLSLNQNYPAMEEELTRRRRQILEICQAKGFKDSDIPVHEDSEKPSLYHYTALNLFMCM